jgi:ribosomal protein S18 acetylase RimI-like enzyme
VAEQDGELIGSLFIDQFGSQVAFIFRLVVDKEYRNKGVATALINKAQEILKARGTKEVALLVDAENTVLQDFYGKKNYKLGKHSYKTMWRSLQD